MFLIVPSRVLWREISSSVFELSYILRVVTQLCSNFDSYKQYQVFKDAIRLRLFLFSLSWTGRQWFNSMTPNSITTWEEMTKKFMLKFFPPSWIVHLRIDITLFIHLANGSFYDTWETLKDLLRKCPYNEIQPLAKFKHFRMSWWTKPN